MFQSIRPFALFFFLTSAMLSGETGNSYLFDSLSLEDGLSNSSVSTIQQDSKGFLWFGTQSGLNRFNGYEFIIYNHDTFNSNSLPHELIQSLFIDNEDIIWIGTYNGISRFDPSTEIFTNFEYEQDKENSISNNVVTDIAKDGNGMIWIATLGGLNCLNPATGSIKKYLHSETDPDSLLHDTVRTLLIDSSGRIWVGNLGGIDLYHKESDSFIHYESLPSPYVMKLLEYSKNILAVGIWGGGITLFDVDKETFLNTPLGDNSIYTMEIDSLNNIWVGTWSNGLFIFNPEDQSSFAVNKNKKDRSSIKSDTIYSLFRDKRGMMWIGTNGNGLYKHNSRKKDYTFLEEGENSISPGKVESIVEDKKGNLWIGIYNGGLNYYNLDSGITTRYKHDSTDSSSLSNDIINDILIDSNEDLWVSTLEGLNKFDPLREEFEKIFIFSDKHDAIQPTYTDLFEDKAGNFWIGSHNFGLFLYDRITKEVKNFQYREGDKTTISDNLISTIEERENGELWVGTNNGLNRFNRKTGQFKRYQLDRTNPTGINNNSIRILLEDSRRNLWIGTGGGGINLYKDVTDQFRHFTTRDGLSNNFIMSLEEDNSGNIWAGSKYGLSIINQTTKKIHILNKEDGIRSMEFTSGSNRGSDHSLYMGSIGLVNKFHIDITENKVSAMDIHINSLDLSGKKNSDISPYTHLKDLVLEHKDSNYFAFEYVALNYQNPSIITYAYKLVGFDDSWIENKDRRFAIYTNIPPGQYTFQVKAAYADGSWQKRIAEQNITIKPPLWKTWWAYSIYAIFIAAFIFLLVSMRTSFLRKEQIQSLKDAESYLTDILNSMPSILIGIDEHMTITQWNKETEKNTGKGEVEAKGEKLNYLIPDLPLSEEEILESINSERILSRTTRKQNGENQMSFEAVTIYPLKNGIRKEAVIRIDDVTKQIRMEEVLIQSEKMLSVGGLAAGMAHEINNPLAGVIQNAAVLSNRLWRGFSNKSNKDAAEKSNITMDGLKKYMEEREIPQLIESINVSGKRIADIIDNMLSFAKKDDSIFTLANLEQLLEKTLELAAADYDLKKQYDFKTIKTIREFEDNMPLVPCERTKIQQVILNILRNGAEAMSDYAVEKPQFTFRIYRKKEINSIVLEIEDNGPGIEPEIQKRIFEPFFTTKPVGIGTGLGLSISYFIITENHNGQFYIKSTPGNGARFIIRLPIEN